MYGEKVGGDFVPETYQMGKGNIEKLGQWDSRQCLMALYSGALISNNQGVILDEL